MDCGADEASRGPDPATLAYYEREAVAYAAATVGADMGAAQQAFLQRLPRKPRVLDAGCGSGRDALLFRQRGCTVTAIDGSPAMAAEAARRLGVPVAVVPHQQVTFVDAFDGIWASATLLHVPFAELPDVLACYRRALVPGGILFASFKRGRAHGPDAAGRWFTNFTSDALLRFVSTQPGWRVLSLADVPDAERPAVRWVSCLLRRDARDGKDGPLSPTPCHPMA